MNGGVLGSQGSQLGAMVLGSAGASSTAFKPYWANESNKAVGPVVQPR